MTQNSPQSHFTASFMDLEWVRWKVSVTIKVMQLSLKEYVDNRTGIKVMGETIVKLDSFPAQVNGEIKNSPLCVI